MWPSYKVRLLTGLSSYSTYVCTDCAHAMSSVVPLVRNVAIVENVDLCTENVRKVMYTCYKLYNALDSCVRLSTSVECVECLCRCNLIAPIFAPESHTSPHLPKPLNSELAQRFGNSVGKQRKLQLVTTTTCASGRFAPVERRETPQAPGPKVRM